MRATAALLGTVVVVSLVAVGCGSSDHGADDDPGGATTSASVEMTDAEASQLLLTPEEVGPGWTADPTGGRPGVTPSCLADVEAGDAVATGDASFANGQTVSAFEGLGVQASEDEARSAYEAVVDALDGCQNVTFRSDGDTVSGTITSNGDAGVGDESSSYSMAYTAEGLPVGMEVVVAYVGEVDVIVMHRTVGRVQPGAADAMAKAAVDKVRSAS